MSLSGPSSIRTTQDLKAAHALQDAIQVNQTSAGKFEVPNWDQASQGKVREALSALGARRPAGSRTLSGQRQEVDPVDHLIGTAIGWGGNPSKRHVCSFYPQERRHDRVQLTVKDVPVDGFWSISVYNAKGFFEKNPLTPIR